MTASFFVEDLVESLLGPEAVDVTSGARRFFADPVVEAVADIRAAFRSTGTVPLVSLEGVLRPERARAMAAALGRAPFRRHHHTPYRLDVAPVDELEASELRRFCRWLATADAARFHAWLVGLPLGEEPWVPRQVQVARAIRGDAFPVHVDMDEEGLSAVYNLSRGFSATDGGVLTFPEVGFEVPPRFNSLTLFRPRAAPHGVTEVKGGRARYTVTAFFVSDFCAR